MNLCIQTFDSSLVCSLNTSVVRKSKFSSLCHGRKAYEIFALDEIFAISHRKNS